MVLFGSLEKEDVHLRSDIDLLVVWETYEKIGDFL
ncbi:MULTISPECIES: nucleotidyltransferase domain-containing protein [Thermoanaerobacter]|nr:MULTISPECIES: nucleotidyltransferase domain-containing protein [Thermoanaerobacter]